MKLTHNITRRDICFHYLFLRSPVVIWHNRFLVWQGSLGRATVPSAGLQRPFLSAFALSPLGIYKVTVTWLLMNSCSSKRCPGIGFFSRVGREIGVFRHVTPPTTLRLEFPRETGLILRCAGNVDNAGDPGSIPWRRKWQPIPVLLPGKSHGWKSLVGYSLWGRSELETTEQLHFHFQN